MAEESLSLEETNKIRLALGLKPLGGSSAAATSTSTATQDEMALENWRRQQEAEDVAREKSAAMARIQKAKNRTKRFEILEGKGLGDGSDEETSVKKWVKRNRKQLLQNASSKQLLAATTADGAELAQYGEQELAGLRVAHDIDDITGDTVLTLKDTSVLDEDGDELESSAVAEKARLREKLNLKKKSSKYVGYDDEEFNEQGKQLLGKYDEEGKKQNSFLLGQAAATQRTRKPEKTGLGSGISLDIDQAVPSDYEAEDLKIKKPKRKRPRTMRQRENDETELLAPAMERPNLDEANFIDDEDLQAALAAQRRQTLKRTKLDSIEELARQLKADADGPRDEQIVPGGMLIDEVTGFVNGLRPDQDEDDGGEKMDTGGGSPETKGPSSTEAAAPSPMVKEEEDDETALIEEPRLHRGVGAAVAMLQQRGVMDRPTQEVYARQELQRKHAAWVAEKRRADALAELEKRRRKEEEREQYKHLTPKEREWRAQEENRRRERQEAHAEVAQFKEYKPDVQIKYKDEFGRDMTPKEAFKHMSHQFHGKGSGNKKTEKRLKRIEEELSRERSAFSQQPPVPDGEAAGKRGVGVRLQ